MKEDLIDQLFYLSERVRLILPQGRYPCFYTNNVNTSTDKSLSVSDLNFIIIIIMTGL